ncbi:MAG: transporter substrate-binding domain-containing protein [Pseudomonadota bacterium]
MLFAWKWTAALAMLLMIAPAQAKDAPARLRICAMDVDYPPFGKVDGTGHLQYLVQQTAKGMNLELERHIAPRRRCLEEIKTGISDAMASAYSPLRAEIAAFPLAGSGVDASKAMGVMTYYAYRRTGSALEWDGRRFRELGDKKLGVQAGFVYVTDRFTQLGVPYDDGVKALEPTLAKLAAGRVEGVVGMMEETDGLIAKHYPGQMERAGKVFDQTPIYLMVSRQYYSQNPKLVERLWHAMRSYRASEAYRRYQLANP